MVMTYPNQRQRVPAAGGALRPVLHVQDLDDDELDERSEHE